MRSLHPMPGNPWPHEMTIRVEDSSESLMTLLWVRAAYELHPRREDLPPELSSPPSRISEAERQSPPITDWEGAWAGLWWDCVEDAARDRGPAIRRLLELEPGADGRAELLQELEGPSWRSAFGDEGLDGCSEWRREQIEAGLAAMRRDKAVLDRERTVLDALVPAWRAGLTTVVEIPCVGAFTRRVGPHALLVTAETRADRDRYREALRMFAG